jgi:nitrate/nitrite-specific signal transduction histidine kinase
MKIKPSRQKNYKIRIKKNNHCVALETHTLMTTPISRRRLCIAGAAVFCLPVAAPVAHAADLPEAGALPLASAINKSGRQRMLIQRLGKSYAMQALGVEPELAAKIRQQSEALFVSQLDELRNTTPSSQISQAVAALAHTWDTYKRDLALPSDKENAQRIFVSSNQTLQCAEELTLLYERQLGASQGHLVNIAGRERMLSQRMAYTYYFGKLGCDSGKQLDMARKEFVAGLNELFNAPQTTPGIRQELELARQQWFFYESGINKASASSDRNIATTSERILEQMNLITEKYEKLSA